jgi:hypothetical protein
MGKTGLTLLSAAFRVVLVCGVVLLGSLGCTAAREKLEGSSEPMAEKSAQQASADAAKAAASNEEITLKHTLKTDEEITLKQFHELQSKAVSEGPPHETSLILNALVECQQRKYAADHGDDRLQEFIDKKTSEVMSGKSSAASIQDAVQETFIRMGYSCSAQEVQEEIEKQEQQREQYEQQREREEKLVESGRGVTCDGVALSETGDCIPPGEDYWMVCDAPTRAAVVEGKTFCAYGGGGS